jgi:hypothetical protein
MADKVISPVVIEIGEVKGIWVTMARSRSSRFALIKDEFGNGDHIALSTTDKVKWSDRPDVGGEHLLAFFKDLVLTQPNRTNSLFWKIFPEYDGIPLSKFGFQTGSNDAISGTRDDIHAHVVFALDETWYSGAIPRFVDPIDPIPQEKRKRREK